MQRIKSVSYTLGAQFAPLIANGDASELTDDEAHGFDSFEREVQRVAPEGYSFSHWSIDTDDYNEFARCEVTDLLGACYRVDAIYFHDAA